MLVSQEGVMISDGVLGQAIVDPHLPALLPLLHDGSYDQDQMARLLQSQQPPAATFLSLERSSS